MSTDYRWEFGFDFNAAPDLAKVSAPTDPTAGAPIYLLQNGLVQKTAIGGVAAWPSSMVAGDSMEFRVFDLTSLQGTSNGSTSITQSVYTIVNPQTAAEELIFQGSPFSGQGLVPIQGGSKPTAWPSTAKVPAWDVVVNEGQLNQKSSFILTAPAPPADFMYATLSLLVQVQQGSDTANTKWFGLDPEIWIMDG